jgi:ribosomal protein L19E
MSEHGRRDTERLAPDLTVRAHAAREEVVEAHALALADVVNTRADRVHHARDLVPKRDRQRAHGREAGAVVRIGMTDARGPHVHAYLARRRLAYGALAKFQRAAKGCHLDRSHATASLRIRVTVNVREPASLDRVRAAINA